MTVTTTGPLFDGRAQRTAKVMVDEITDELAQEAFEEVGAALDVMLKNPTGYYESQITVDRSRDTAVVHDSGVVYGPWLAGVSSRNQSSRFKGYTHWRRAVQRTQASVERVSQPIVRRRVAEMNGH